MRSKYLSVIGMKSRFLQLSTGILFLTLLNALARDQAARFPLMAWDYAHDKATLKSMHDCGINMVAFVPPALLDACQKNEIKAIVFDESVAGHDWAVSFNGDAACSNLPALIKKTGRHPAVAGYFLKDEPVAGEFPAVAKASAKVKELAPGKWPYVNLFPGEGESYDAYLEQFITTCQPPAVSYDRYVLAEDGSFGPVFWSNLAQVRDAARKHKLPFWNVVLTAPHWHYRELTPVDVRLQIFGSLVYGVSGIAYYRFRSAMPLIHSAPDLGNFRMAPLDQFGERTPTWDWLRNVNRQVQNMASVLLKLRSDDVYHFGSVPARNHGPTDKTLVKSFAQADWEMVAGDFTHEDGGRWVMIVNKSLKHSYPCNPRFNVPPKGLQYVSPWDGKGRPFPSHNIYNIFWLAPGQGVLLRLQ